MAWQRTLVTYWTVCRWFIFPYPCKKSKYKYCATGRVKVQCYGFFGQFWFCVDGEQYHWWGWCWGIGDVVDASSRFCRDEIPKSDGDCTVVGEAPPGSGSGSYALVAEVSPLNLVIGIGLGSILGIFISLLSGIDLIVVVLGMVAIGGILGGTRSTYACEFRRYLIVLILVLLVIYLTATSSGYLVTS